MNVFIVTFIVSFICMIVDQLCVLEDPPNLRSLSQLLYATFLHHLSLHVEERWRRNRCQFVIATYFCAYLCPPNLTFCISHAHISPLQVRYKYQSSRSIKRYRYFLSTVRWYNKDGYVCTTMINQNYWWIDQRKLFDS